MDFSDPLLVPLRPAFATTDANAAVFVAEIRFKSSSSEIPPSGIGCTSSRMWK